MAVQKKIKIFSIVAFLCAWAFAFALGFNTVNTSATTGSGNTSNTVGANISSSIAIRLLDSTASTDITRLDFNLTPTAPGTSFNPSISQGTERTVVDVATSNPTGYKLYMQSNYQDSSSNYTTDLVHTTSGTPDADIADTIPTSTSASTLYWNYTNPMTSSATVIPAHGNPDKLDQYYDATNSRQTPVDINVSVDTTIVSGTYQNQLLFSAVGNPEPVSYSVSFDGNGGSPVPSTITGSATSSTFSTAIDSTIPVKTGYTFSHWQITSVSSTSPTPDINPTATCNSTSTCNPGDSLDISTYGEPGVVVALTAVYTINTHTVTITNGAGIDSTTITCSNSTNNTTNTCTYGDTVTISATPATGYSFDSWTTTSGGVTPVSPTSATTTFTMPDEAVAITASGIKMYNYTFQFDGNAGSETVTGLPALQNYPQQTLSSYTITIPSGTPVRSGYTFTGYNTKQDGSGTTYQPGNTITATSASAGSTPDSDGYPVTTTLYAVWSKNSYTINLTGSNVSITNTSGSSISSISVPYGGTATFKITPTSGYYLSAHTCASLTGYSCSTISTGTSATGTQTITITNNNSTNTGTLSFTGTLAQTLQQACAAASVGGTFTYNSIDYIKLKTNSAGTTSACYTKSSQGMASWVNASSKCPSGTGVPSKTDFDNLITAYGSSSGLNNATGWGPGSSNTAYWSSTEYNSSLAYNLAVRSSDAGVYNFDKAGSRNVVCIVPPKTIADSTYLQEVQACPDTLDSNQHSLIDQGEPSKSYNTARLADGKCWMTTNYYHSAGTLSSTYYNVSSSGYTIPPSKCDKSGTNQFAGYCDGDYGDYYSYTVATAGSNSTTYSICPKGWRLPTQAEYNTLISTYGAKSAGSKLAQSPVNMRYGGFCSPNVYACGYNAGLRGYYWSSTVIGSNSYYLDFSSSSARTNAGFSPSGYSVRCVFGS